MTREEKICETLHAILWDYQIDPLDFYELALGENDILQGRKNSLYKSVTEKIT